MATCAYGALASVPVVGRWLCSVVGDWARKQFVSLVVSIVIRWF